MREGEKWFYETCTLIRELCDISLVNYCGFQRVHIGNSATLAGVFEFPREFKFTEEQIDKLQGYASERIHCIRVYNRLASYRNCILVVLKSR